MILIPYIYREVKVGTIANVPLETVKQKDRGAPHVRNGKKTACPEKMYFKNVGKIKTCSDLKTFLMHRPVPWEMFNEVLQAEGK